MKSIKLRRGPLAMGVAASCFAVILSGCHPKQVSPTLSPEPLVDSQLRGFLGVQTLNGSYTLPPDKSAYLLTWLEIEDGKLLRTGAITSDGSGQAKNRKIDVQFLWGEVNGKMKTALCNLGNDSRSESDFWRAFEHNFGLRNYKEGEEKPIFEGYTILGFVTSDVTRDGKSNAAYSGDFAFEVKGKKYIGALALKSFQTHEQLDQAIREARDANKPSSR